MRRRRVGRAISVAALILCGLLVATLMILSQGFPVRKLDLNDSGVWVSNDTQHQLGRVNKSAGGLDAWVDIPGNGKQTADVLQDGNAVVQFDVTQKILTPVNSAAAQNFNEGALQLPSDSLVDMRGGTLAALDLSTGKVFGIRYDPNNSIIALHGINPEGAPLVELGVAPDRPARRGALSVGSDGTIHAVLANGKRATIRPTVDGFTEPKVDSISEQKSVQIAAVGDRGVTYDAETGYVTLPDGKSVQLPTDPDGVIQQGGPDSPWALVATKNGLFRVQLSDGFVSRVTDKSSGAPAAPVRLAGCDFAAWAGDNGTVMRACGTDPAKELAGIRSAGVLVRPVFRVNREQIVLNDAADGRIFDLTNQTRLDAWDQIKPQPKGDEQNPNQSIQPKPQDAKPEAHDDVVGVRPGRTVIAHVLDNDTDALGQVLMVTGVSGVPSGAKVVIAPDGQSIAVTPPSDSAGFSFGYSISNGHNGSEAKVRVEIRQDGNAKPQLRPGYANPEYTVASFGTLPLSVLGDWRDPDGDPVTLMSAEADGVAVPVTPEGRIEFTAGREETQTVKNLVYRVSDGHSEPIEHRLPVTVLDAKTLTGTAPLTFPDAIRGEVGKPIVFNPLANDLPGSDPRTPDARLQLGGTVKPIPGVDLESDIHSGQVTATATAPGSYELSYSAAFGSAPMKSGKIRLDVTEASSERAPTVMPDQVTARGIQTVRIDPLANDSDATGGILTVTDVTADENQFDATIVSGRWVLITPKNAQPATNPTVIRYSVTNGEASASGDILVTQLPKLDEGIPIVKDDVAVVRAGDSVLINALINDVDPSGEPLNLSTNLAGQKAAGELVVYDPGLPAGSQDLGRAFIRHDQIRYVAPKKVEGERQVVIEYYAQSQSGRRSPTGKVLVTIKPEPASADQNHAPTPQAVEARITSGDAVKVSISPNSQDPDGDSVVMVGLGSAPKLGRVIGQSPTSITYEAYPNPEAYGTDTFSVLVADRFGKASAAVVRIGVTPPGAPQAPITIPDQVLAAPGAIVRVDAMANDLYARADKVSYVPLERTNGQLPAGVQLESETGPVLLQAPQKDTQPTVLQYALRGNGGQSVPAAIRVSAVEGYQNPPVVFDEVATADGDVAKVNVLQRAWDPDGDDGQLKAAMLNAPEGARMDNGQATIPLTGQIQIIPYTVTDAAGAVSAAVIFVPSSGTAAPHVKQGALIEMSQDQSVTLNLADYVVSPRQQKVRFTPRTESFSASPSGKLQVEPTGPDTFKVTSTNGYIGPGAVTFEVMDGESLSGNGVLAAYVNVPVQIGPATPVLRCPETSVTLLAGGRDESLDIATLCHVWAPDPNDIPKLSYTAEWDGTPISGVEFEPGKQLTLRANGSTPPGSTGRLMIGIEGSNATKNPISLEVRSAPPPTMQSQTLNDIKEGTAVRIPVGIVSPLRDGKPQVVSATRSSGPEASHTVEGSVLTITPAAKATGDLIYQITGTDVDDHSRTDRHVTGTLTLKVYGAPEAPGAPRIGQDVQSKSVNIEWSDGADNGAPITAYEVLDSTGQIHSCPGSPCRITGLTNGTPVSFQVRAQNKAGWSDYGPASETITPDEIPPAPTGLRISDVSDRSLVLSWDPVQFDGSPIRNYHITVGGQSQTVAGTATSARITMPDNNRAYEIQLVAENDYRRGPAARITGQSAGSPQGLIAPKLTPSSTTNRSITVVASWTQAVANGPGDLSYTLTRKDGKVVCSNVRALSCADEGVIQDGRQYTYELTATNGAGKSIGALTVWHAIGVPSTPSRPNAARTDTAGKVRVTGNYPDSLGTRSTLKIFSNGEERYSAAASARGGSYDQTIDVGTSGGKRSITAQICNENGCGGASAAAEVTMPDPVGAIEGLKIEQLSLNGTDLQMRVSVNPNGKKVTVTVEGNDGYNKSFETGTGAWHQNINRTLDWSTSYTFTVRASDGTRSAGPERLTVEVGAKPQEPRPSGPTITFSRGDAQPTQCDPNSSNTCPELLITLRRFDNDDIDCKVYTSNPSDTKIFDDEFDDNGTYSLGHQRRPARIWAKCEGVDSEPFDW